VGRFITKRENITLLPEVEKGFANKMKSIPASFAGMPVADIVTLDGTKCILDDGGWLLFRKSGTEPVVRLYAEASSEEKLKAIIAAGRDFILS